MNVVFIASTLKRGGAERITGEISSRLSNHGINVLWALLREPGAEGESIRKRGLEMVTRIGVSRFLNPMVVMRLQKVLTRHSAEAIYCLDHQNAVVTTALAAPLAGVKRRFLAVHTTGLWGNRPSLPAGVRNVLPSFTRVIAVARSQGRYLIEHEGVDPGRLVVIRNGIDLDLYAPTPERIARGKALRAGLAEGSTAPVIGVVAALRPEKGHALLFQAMERLLRVNTGLRLVLVGDGEERATLERLAATLRIAHAVTFLGDRDDVADLLQAFDLVVLASHPSVETLPLALIEAMAAGRAVVATRVGSVDEIVIDGVTGALVAPDDVASLSGAILRLVGDRLLREGYGRHGLEKAQEFTLDETVAQTAALLMGQSE